MYDFGWTMNLVPNFVRTQSQILPREYNTAPYVLLEPFCPI